MASPATRRSDRVSLTLLLEVSGKDSFGKEFKAPTRTLLINRGGAVIVLDQELSAEQQVHLPVESPVGVRYRPEAIRAPTLMDFLPGHGLALREAASKSMTS